MRRSTGWSLPTRTTCSVKLGDAKSLRKMRNLQRWRLARNDSEAHTIHSLLPSLRPNGLGREGPWGTGQTDAPFRVRRHVQAGAGWRADPEDATTRSHRG